MDIELMVKARSEDFSQFLSHFSLITLWLIRLSFPLHIFVLRTIRLFQTQKIFTAGCLVFHVFNALRVSLDLFWWRKSSYTKLFSKLDLFYIFTNANSLVQHHSMTAQRCQLSCIFISRVCFYLFLGFLFVFLTYLLLHQCWIFIITSTIW